MLLVRRLGLLADDLVSGSGVLCRKGNDILLTQVGDGSGNDGLDAFTLAYFARNRGRDRRALRLTQILHALQKVLRAHDINDRRLLQINLQRLVQRGVKHRVTRAVDEIRQDERVLLRLRPSCGSPVLWLSTGRSRGLVFPPGKCE